MFRVDKMRVEDFPFAIQLSNTMDWDMAESDFDFMMKLEPEGCFVLWQAQERLGLATCISYDRVGWFGNLIIKTESRRRGAGTFLLEHAVKYLKNKGVETIGLFAYQHLIGFYESVGFKPYDEFMVLKGKPSKVEGEKLNVSEATESNLPMLIRLDQRCFGWNRRRLFEAIMGEKGKLCCISELDGKVAAFAVAKVHNEIAEVGPLVCGRGQNHLAVQLLEALLSVLKESEAYSCVRIKDKYIFQTLLNAGLKENFQLTRMFLGPSFAQECVYMPESLERG